MTDLDIARKVVLKPIAEIAKKLGVDQSKLEPYGKYKAKLPLSLIDKKRAAKSKLILVSAISPTPAGEGKTQRGKARLICDECKSRKVSRGREEALKKFYHIREDDQKTKK